MARITAEQVIERAKQDLRTPRSMLPPGERASTWASAELAIRCCEIAGRAADAGYVMRRPIATRQTRLPLGHAA